MGCPLRRPDSLDGCDAIRNREDGNGISWTLRNSSGVSEGIYKSVVQSDREFLNVGVGGSTPD